MIIGTDPVVIPLSKIGEPVVEVTVFTTPVGTWVELLALVEPREFGPGVTGIEEDPPVVGRIITGSSPVVDEALVTTPVGILVDVIALVEPTEGSRFNPTF